MTIFEIKNNVSLTTYGRESQSGRSMIEMLGVLAIIGVLSVGGIAGYSKAMMKYKINKSIEQITLIAGNVRTFWGPQRNYDGVECYTVYRDGSPSGCDPNGCPIHKKAKIFPDDMITVTDGKITSITNPFGSEVGLHKEDKAKFGDNQAFYIDYSDIPQEACIELATHDWSTAQINILKIYFGPDYSVRTPVSVDDAITLCSLDDSTTLSLFVDVDVSSNYWKQNLENCSVEKGGC